MSTPTLPDHSPTVQAPSRPRSKAAARIAAFTLAPAALLALGAAAGYTAQPEPEPVTITKPVQVEVPAELPEACLNAYRLAEEAMLGYEGYPALTVDALDAVSAGDAAGLGTAARKVETLNEDMQTALRVYFLTKLTCEDQLDVTLPSAVTNAGLS